MNAPATTEAEAVENTSELTVRLPLVRLPLGLLGFETHKDYTLVASPEEEPFLWLQMVGEPNQPFLVVPPSAVLPDYHPDLSHEDVKFLDLEAPEDAVVLNIVTLHKDNRATVNFKGPIVLNRRT